MYEQKYKVTWEVEAQFLEWLGKETNWSGAPSDSIAECKYCTPTKNIGSQGKCALIQHMKGKKHKEMEGEFLKSRKLKPIGTFFDKSLEDKVLETGTKI